MVKRGPQNCGVWSLTNAANSSKLPPLGLMQLGSCRLCITIVESFRDMVPSEWRWEVPVELGVEGRVEWREEVEWGWGLAERVETC